MLGSNSSAYRALSAAADGAAALAGGDLLTWLSLRRTSESGEEISVHPRSLSAPLVVRLGTQDTGAVIDNAIRQEYGQLPNSVQPKIIVDAGAYIGDTSAYLLSKYPEAKVIALEPNRESLVLAERNLQAYGARVTIEAAALWSTDGETTFGGEQMGSQAARNGSVVVPTISIPTLMLKHRLPRIDLLKVDIEGAEVEVFCNGAEGWLRKTGAVIVETHGLDCEQAVLPILSSAGFHIHRYRNLWYCLRAE